MYALFGLVIYGLYWLEIKHGYWRRKHWVYRLPTYDGSLGYIGYSVHPRKRIRQHAEAYANGDPAHWWWTQIDVQRARIGKPYKNRPRAWWAEQQAIRRETPLFNQVHNRKQYAKTLKRHAMRSVN